MELVINTAADAVLVGGGGGELEQQQQEEGGGEARQVRERHGLYRTTGAN
jgi:hypothetical protein